MSETRAEHDVRQGETPAFIIDLRVVRERAAVYERIRQETGVRVLYATKPLLHRDVLTLLAGTLDGFVASSLYSAALCREVLSDRPMISLVTPGYRPDEINEIGALCDQVVLNSLPQWRRFGADLARQASVGLRVNPGLSYLPDTRYDPGLPGGKLGVPLETLAATPLTTLSGLSGLHFHSNCDSPDYAPLRETVEHVCGALDPLLQTVSWINIGGGYRLPHPDEWGPLYRAIATLQERYRQATIYMEPGASLVRESGALVASVLDLFETAQGAVAILDTSVNHLPEVFEYQYAPEVAGHNDGHPHEYTLAGATCLAGDRFGVYRFAEPLSIGSQIIFPNVGAYSLAKAHWFNGVALPTLYTIDLEGHCHLRRHYDREDYRRHLGWPGIEKKPIP